MQLVVQTGPDAGKVFNLDRPVLVVGRQMGNDVLLNDTQVSRRHVQFELRDGQVFVIDLGSANGTTINGQKLAANEPRLLRAGDLIRLGASSIALQDAVATSYPGPVAIPNPAYGPPPAAFGQAPVTPSPYQNQAQPPYYNNPPAPGYPQPGPVYPVPAYAQPPIATRPKNRNNGVLIVLGVLLIGAVLVGVIALLGSEAGKSATPGVNTVQPVNGSNGNPAEPTATLAPSPTVVRGQSGTNLPPPSPPSLFSTGLSAQAKQANNLTENNNNESS